MIGPEKISYKDVCDIVGLKVSEAQKEFVAGKVLSLAQAYAVLEL